MPCRISQVTPVTFVFSILSDKTHLTVHSFPTRRSSDLTLAYSPLPSEVLSSLASPLTPLKSPLYKSGPEPPGVQVGEPAGVAVAVGVGVGVPGQPVVPFTPMEKSVGWPSLPVDVKLAPKKLLSKNAFWRLEEHTSELQSRLEVVCRVRLLKKPIGVTLSQ